MTDSRKSFKVALSRTLNEFDLKNSSKPSPAVDAKHVHIYLSRQYSRGSLVPLLNHENLNLDSKSKCVTEKCPSLSQAQTIHVENVPVADSSQAQTSTQRRMSLKTPSFVGTHVVSSVSPNLSPDAPGRLSGCITSLKRPICLETTACQVCDYLFMSGVEAAFNAHFLCKFNIEFLIDVTNTEPRDVPRHRKSDVPCVCARETAHSRARMTISVEEDSALDMTPYFEDANRFIDSARACGKSVLIYSFHGHNRNAVFVVQYLMKMKGLSCDRAVQFLKEKCPKISISSNFYTSLRKWDVMLNLINASQAATVSKRSTPFVKKTAWL